MSGDVGPSFCATRPSPSTPDCRVVHADQHAGPAPLTVLGEPVSSTGPASSAWDPRRPGGLPTRCSSGSRLTERARAPVMALSGGPRPAPDGGAGNHAHHPAAVPVPHDATARLASAEAGSRSGRSSVSCIPAGQTVPAHHAQHGGGRQSCCNRHRGSWTHGRILALDTPRAPQGDDRPRNTNGHHQPLTGDRRRARAPAAPRTWPGVESAVTRKGQPFSSQCGGGDRVLIRGHRQRRTARLRRAPMFRSPSRTSETVFHQPHREGAFANDGQSSLRRSRPHHRGLPAHGARTVASSRIGVRRAAPSRPGGAPENACASSFREQ